MSLASPYHKNQESYREKTACALYSDDVTLLQVA